MSEMEKESGETLLFGDFRSVSKESWKKEVEKKSPGSYEDLVWTTEDGIAVEPLYTQEEAREFMPGEDPPPGEFPFVRGTGRRDNGWLLNEDVRIVSPEDAARAAGSAVKGGADSLTFIEEAEISRETVGILLRDVDLLQTAVSFVPEKDPEKIAGFMVSLCEERGIDPAKLEGALFFDPLSRVRTGASSAAELESGIEKIAGAVKYLSDRAPRCGAFSVKSGTFKDSGATITQELAFTVAAAAEYIVMLLEKGVRAEDACRHLVFSFSTGSSYFAETAKIRAARALWAGVAEKFAPGSPESAKMRIHCRTATFNKTVYDPHVNVLRAALEAMASVIGGTDSLTVDPFDARWGNPDEFSKRAARNIQLLIRNESHLGAVTDPGGGSYHIEKLTQSIARRSLELFQEIEEKGGYLACAKSGFVEDAVRSSREKTLRDVSRRKKTLVGTNEFPNPEEKMLERLRKFSPGETETAGGIPDAGAAADFERIRLLVERLGRERGEVPKVFLLHLSGSAQASARSVFAMNFFGCGGFSVIDGAASPGVRKGTESALRENPLAVVVCGSDGDYGESGGEAVKILRDAEPEMKIVIPGGPEGVLDELARAGADDFINAGSDVCGLLERYQRLFFARGAEK